MQYHVTGVFLVEDPEQTSADVFAAAVHGTVGLDDAVIVSSPAVDSALLTNLTQLLGEVGIEPHRVVRDGTQSLAAQLAPIMQASRELSGRNADESWLWFLTDDAVVPANGLAQQLQAVEISPSVAITGAKHLAGRHLINVGLTVAADGHIVSLIEPGELDQGQYDHRTDVFAVSTPGMLVKTKLFEDLGGFDPQTPATARTVDLCWRARLAGHRVAVVPGMAVQHDELPAEPPVADTWETARWLRLKHTGVFGVLGGWLWGMLSAIGVLIGGLLVKDPRSGAARAAGIARTLKRPAALLRSRGAASATRKRPFDAVAELRPTRSRIRDFRRSVLETHDGDRVIGDGTGVTAAPQQATGGHDDFDELATPDRNWVGIGAVTLGIVFGAASLLGLRHLLGVPALAGGNLLPVSDRLDVLLAKAASGWAITGAGAPGFDGPFGWLLVLFGLTTNASAVLVWLWVLALPLAGLGAWALAGAITRSRYIRFAAGIAWASAPLLFVAVSEGRLGGLLVHLALPWFALAVVRAIGYPEIARRVAALQAQARVDTDREIRLGRRPRHLATTSLTAAAWVAILLTVITAASPAAFIPLTIGLILLMVVFRAKLKVLWWTPLLAASTLVPAAVTHRLDLRAIFADPGAPAGYDPAPTWQLLLGLPHNTDLAAGLAELPWLNQLSPELPWMGIAVGLIAVPVVLLGLIGALVPGPSGTLARAGMITAVLGLATATLSAGIIVSIDQTGTPVALSTIPATSLTWLGLVIAAISGLNVLTRPRIRHRPGAALSPAGWPVRTATSVLVATGIIATGLWLTPRMVPGETLHQAQETAMEQRSIAAAEAATDTDLTDTDLTDTDLDDSTRAELQYLTGTPTVTGVMQRSLPATAVDSAESVLQTRTLVITRTFEGLRVHLISGQGTLLDDMTGTWTTRIVTGGLFDPQPAGGDDADNMLRTVAAQLTSGADADPRAALEALGAGYVVLTDPSGTETTLAASMNAAPGLASVGHTQRGWLWRVDPVETHDDADEQAPQLGVEVLTAEGSTPARGTTIGRARIVAGDQTVAIAASEPNGSIDVLLPDAMSERQLVLSERANPGFRAWLNGEELESTVTSPEWIQAFELPETGGQLTVDYAPPAGRWLWLIPGIIGLITLLLAIPTPVRATSGRVDDQR